MEGHMSRESLVKCRQKSPGAFAYLEKSTYTSSVQIMGFLLSRSLQEGRVSGGVALTRMYRALTDGENEKLLSSIVTV
jgi:hypothetical protein